MKQVNQIVLNAGSLAATNQKISDERKQAIIEQVDYIIKRLASNFGYTPKNINEVKKNWLVVLASSAIKNTKQIEQGINRIISDPSQDFFPRPAHFVKLCLESPESGLLPSLDESYAECRKNAHAPRQSQWTHELAYWAGFGMWYHLRQTTKDEPSAQFRQQYQAAVDQFNNGNLKPIPQHEKVLQDQTNKAVTPEEKSQLKILGNETLKNCLNCFT